MGMRAFAVVVVLAGCGSKASGPSKAECSGYVDHASRLEQEGGDDYMPMFKYSRSERDVFLARCPKVLSKKMIDCAIAATTLAQLDACQPRRSVDGAIEGDGKKQDDHSGPVVEEQFAAAPGEAARIAEQRAAEERMMREARGLPPEEAPKPPPEAPKVESQPTAGAELHSQEDPPPPEEEELYLKDGELTGGTGCRDACLQITGIAPYRGAPAGGDLVEIAGDLFVDRSVKVFVGGRVAQVVRVDTKLLVIRTPAGTDGETVDVEVVFEPGGLFAIRDGFSYGAAPAPSLDDLDTE